MSKLSRLVRFWVLWFMATAFLCLSVSLAQMYAREDTLDSVREIDFKVVYQAVVSGSRSAADNFKTVADELSIFNGQVVLFPMALLTDVTCINNGPSDSKVSICRKFQNIDDWHNRVSEVAPNNKYTPYRYFQHDGYSYIYQDIGPKALLVGEAGAYSSINPYANPLEAFYREVISYYLGTAGGIKKLLVKGKWAAVFIFSSSLVVTILFLLFKRILEAGHASKVRELEESLARKDGEWSRLQLENGEINLKLRENREQVRALEEKIRLEQEANDKVSEELLAQVIVLEEEKNGLSDERETLQLRIIELEEEIEDIASRQVAESDGGSRDDLVKELVKARLDYQELIQLWRRKTNWNHRLQIESKVSAEAKRVPFTVSTAFIAFENYIDQSYVAEPVDAHAIEPTLREKIDSISNGNPELRSVMHRIRIARNNWFHDGSPPEFGLVKELVRLIEKEEPRI
ncbi:hypothetical protein OAQ35_00960 [Litorivicinus sp.]|nr:hypothetical protein [Litorivicinus sp.]